MHIQNMTMIILFEKKSELTRFDGQGGREAASSIWTII